MRQEIDIGLAKAIKAAGTQGELAARLGITSGAISQWQKVPLSRVIDIEAATGVPRYELRPDFFLPAVSA